MDTLEFEKFRLQLSKLSLRQRCKLKESFSLLSTVDETEDVLETLVAATLSCPRCNEGHPYRHGKAHDMQRYRCKSCGKTFNSLTGTPLAHLRHKEKWLAYLQCVLDSATVRDAAHVSGVHRNTSFRWRHRFLSWVKKDRPERLHGIAEADEAYFLESKKGARNLDREPRKRGGSAKQRGTSKEQVCVLIARDRTKQTIDFVTGRGPVSKAQLQACLSPVLDDDVLLVSDANVAYRYFALEAKISHESINLRAGIRVKGAIHIQNVNAYHSRLRHWINRFHGVATHYLPNYLGWRRALDTRRIDTPMAMLNAAIGIFPHLPVT